MEQLANNAAGTLSANITNVSGSLTLNAGQGAAFPSSGNFRILIDSEIIIVTARSGDVLTLGTRGAEGTAAAAHNSPAAVTQLITAGGMDQFVRDRSVQASVGIADGEFEVYRSSDTSWQRSSVKPASVAGLAPGTVGQYLATLAGPTVGWTTPPVIAPTHLPGVIANGNGTSALTANTAYFIPIPNVVISTVISRIAFRVGTASGNMDIGIYYSDDELTMTRLFAQGSFVVPAAGLTLKAITQQTIAPLTGRRWYYALQADNGTASFGVGNPTSGTPSFPWGTYSKATTFGLAASYTALAVADGAVVPVVHGAI